MISIFKCNIEYDIPRERSSSGAKLLIEWEDQPRGACLSCNPMHWSARSPRLAAGAGGRLPVPLVCQLNVRRVAGWVHAGSEWLRDFGGVFKAGLYVGLPTSSRTPKGGRSFLMSPPPLSGISGLSVWSYFFFFFLISSFVPLPSPVALSVLSFSAFGPFSSETVFAKPPFSER